MENKLSHHITFDNMPSAIAMVSQNVAIMITQLAEFTNSFEPKAPTELLTRKEVAEMFKCDLSTVHNWTKKGILKKYGTGNSIFYKRSEVESALIAL